MFKTPTKQEKVSGRYQSDTEKEEFKDYLKKVFNNPHFLERTAMINLKKYIFDASGAERSNRISFFRTLVSYMEKGRNIKADGYIGARESGKYTFVPIGSWQSNKTTFISNCKMLLFFQTCPDGNGFIVYNFSIE